MLDMICVIECAMHCLHEKHPQTICMNLFERRRREDNYREKQWKEGGDIRRRMSFINDALGT